MDFLNKVTEQVDDELSKYNFVTKYCIISSLLKKYSKKLPKFDQKYVISKLHNQQPIFNHSQVDYLRKIGFNREVKIPLNLAEIENRCDAKLIECLEQFPHWGIEIAIRTKVPITHKINIYEICDSNEKCEIIEKNMNELAEISHTISTILNYYRMPYCYQKIIIIYYIFNKN